MANAFNRVSNLCHGSMTHTSHDIRGEKECSINCGRPLWPLRHKNIDGTRGTQHAESITTLFMRDANMHMMMLVLHSIVSTSSFPPSIFNFKCDSRNLWLGLWSSHCYRFGVDGRRLAGQAWTVRQSLRHALRSESAF